MTRSRWIFLLPLILLLVCRLASAEMLTNEAIVTMVKAGFGEELIIGKIKNSQGAYDLSATGLVRLKAEGVSETIIKAMIEVSASAMPSQPQTPQDKARETQDAIGLYQQGKLVEAAGAFDKLLSQSPDDDELKIWKALTLLEQARAMKDANMSPYKPLVVQAYAILQPLGRKLYLTNADWNFAMAKAFWLNDRPTWAKRAAGKAVDLRVNFAEPQMLLGDLAYDDDVDAMKAPAGNPRAEIARRFAGQAPRKQYEKVLALPDLRPEVRAEALYKLGVVAAQLENKQGTAREYWQRAAAADPDCRYGKLAQEKLQAGPTK
jgi:tetratricopeptide (TPR) repeat protein